MIASNSVSCVLKVWLLMAVFTMFSCQVWAQKDTSAATQATITSTKAKKVFYGQASFYGNKFHGRRTANGETFSQEKFTAACNVLPLGTWIRVTNLKNGKKVIVKTNDRLHPKMRRLVDLSLAAAKKLGFISHGLTRVKIEVVPKGTKR